MSKDNISPYGILTRPKGGISLEVKRLRALGELPIAEQVLSALLRRDSDEVRRLIDQSSRGWVNAFCQLLMEEGMYTLTCSRIFELNLTQCFSSISLGHSGNSHQTLLHYLTAQASQATAIAIKLDVQFRQLLAALGDVGRQIIFLKGVGIGRTLYENFSERLFCDLDTLVRVGHLAEFSSALEKFGYKLLTCSSALYNQREAGPTKKMEDLFIAPHPDFVPFAGVAFKKEGWPPVEVKFDPLERGIRMRELDRLFAEAMTISWQSESFKAPGHIDHLAIQVMHLAKHGFKGWKWLVDISLLSNQLSSSAGAWDQFVPRCKIESISMQAWVALIVARDRAGAPVPDAVLSALAPTLMDLGTKVFAFTTPPLFSWNLSSLPALLSNAAFCGDSRRKFRLLGTAFLPSQEFLRHYYCSTMPPWATPLLYPLHWLTLVLPAGLIRRTYGRLLWPCKK